MAGCHKCGKEGKLAGCTKCGKLWCLTCLKQAPSFGNYMRTFGTFSVTCDCGNRMSLMESQLK